MNDGHEELPELIAEASGGDANAASYLQNIVAVAHIWDDLIDRDRSIPDAKIHDAFTTALFTLPANPFYQRHRALLDPVMLVAMIDWRSATATEREAPCEWTYIARSSYVNLLIVVRMLTGGLEAAIAFASKVRAATHHEGMDGYVSALADERNA